MCEAFLLSHVCHFSVCNGYVCCVEPRPIVFLQVAAKCRHAAGVVKDIIELFAEKPDVYKQPTGKRRAVELWSEGGLGALAPLT